MFLVAVTCSHGLRVVVMDVGMLGLIYHGVRSRTAEPEVSGHGIFLAAYTWRTIYWFLLEVDWINSVWVVVMDVGMLGLMLVRVG